MARRKGSKDYPEGVKREAIRLYLEEGWTTREIAERYAIRNYDQVSSWARKYKKEGEGMFANKRSRCGRKPKKEDTTTYIAWLEMEVDLLKKFHAELRQGSLAKRDIGSLKTTEENTK